MRQIAITCGMMLALAGCGGSSEEHHEEGEEHAGEHHAGGEHHHGEHHGEHGAGTPEVTALHGVVAPIWHSEPGPARGQMACDQRADLEARTTAVVEGAVPEAAAGDAAGWQAATMRLQSSWQAIAMACDGADAGATAEARLTSFHDAFHAVMELAAGD